jgi:hypothetical protein
VPDDERDEPAEPKDEGGEPGVDSLSPPMPLLGVTVRLWLPVLTAVAPSLWLALLLRRTRLRRQRSRAGLCPSCGYDLRAHPQPLPRVRDGRRRCVKLTSCVPMPRPPRATAAPCHGR